MSLRRPLAIALVSSVALAGLITVTATGASGAPPTNVQIRVATDDTTVWAAVLITPLGFANARDIAVNGLDDTVYVISGLGDDGMSVINGRTGLLDDSFSLPGDGGRAVAIDQDDDTIYTITLPTSSGTDTWVQSRPAADPETADTDVAISHAAALAVDSLDDSVYVSRLNNSGITYFSGRTPTVTSTESIGGVPVYGIAVNALDDSVWMGLSTINRIRSWNGATGVLGAAIDPGGPSYSQPDAVAVNSRDNMIYVADSYPGITPNPPRKVIYAVNGLTSAVTQIPVSSVITGSTSSLAVDDSTAMLFATSTTGNRVFIINGANPDDSVTINTGIGPNVSAPGIIPLSAIAVDDAGPNRGLVWGVTGGGGLASRVQAITQVRPQLQGSTSGAAGATVRFSVTPTSLTLPFLMSDNAVWGVRFNGSGSPIAASRVPGTNEWTVTLPSGLPTGNRPVEVFFNGSQYAYAGDYTVQAAASAPTISSVSPSSGPTSGGTSVTITGANLIGAMSATFGGTAGVITANTATSITVTTPAGAAGAVNVAVTTLGGTATSAGAFTYVSPTPPPPPPVFPPGPPTNVAAVAGDSQAMVTWTPPVSAGASAIIEYRVTSDPGYWSCRVPAPATSCTVSGLANGASYMFNVAARNGDGWGPESVASNAVVPRAPSIVISGSRDRTDTRFVRVRGTTADLVGKRVTPYVRFPGESAYTAGIGVQMVGADGTFTWSRKTGKRISVYFVYADVRSNTVAIPFRSGRRGIILHPSLR